MEMTNGAYLLGVSEYAFTKWDIIQVENDITQHAAKNAPLLIGL